MKKKHIFTKYDHNKIIKLIATGLKDAGFLNRYLELGIRNGACFNEIAPLVNEAYAVDIDPLCFKAIKQNKNLNWFNGTTDDFFMRHDINKKFDLIFIDADHSHKSSLKDFESSFKFINENGLILLHDTYPPDESYTAANYCSDTWKTADQLRKACKIGGNFEIVTLPFYYGITIVRSINRQLLWMK